LSYVDRVSTNFQIHLEFFREIVFYPFVLLLFSNGFIVWMPTYITIDICNFRTPAYGAYFKL